MTAQHERRRHLRCGPTSGSTATPPSRTTTNCKQLLLADIADSGRRPGDRLPGDEALGSIYGVSRTVVRQALSELQAAGVIVREKGRGTFVAHQADEGSVTEIGGWFDGGAGGTDAVLLRRALVEPADDRLAAGLQIPVGDPVIHTERVQYAGTEPSAYIVADVPYELAPGLERQKQAERPLAAVLDCDFGIRLVRAHRIIRAVAADRPLAALLGVPETAPLLVRCGISYDQTGRAVLSVASFHRGDRSQFEVEVRRA